MKIRTPLTIALGCSLVFGISLAQDGQAPAPTPVKSERAKKAEEAASKFVMAFTSGDAKTVSALTAVPFAFDRKKIIESKADLDGLFKQIQAKKAKPNKGMEVFSTEILADRSEVLEQCVPTDYVIVKLQVGDAKRKDAITLCVRPTAKGYLVVGFSD